MSALLPWRLAHLPWVGRHLDSPLGGQLRRSLCACAGVFELPIAQLQSQTIDHPDTNRAIGSCTGLVLLDDLVGQPVQQVGPTDDAYQLVFSEHRHTLDVSALQDPGIRADIL